MLFRDGGGKGGLNPQHFSCGEARAGAYAAPPVSVARGGWSLWRGRSRSPMPARAAALQLQRTRAGATAKVIYCQKQCTRRLHGALRDGVSLVAAASARAGGWRRAPSPKRKEQMPKDAERCRNVKTKKIKGAKTASDPLKGSGADGARRGP